MTGSYADISSGYSLKCELSKTENSRAFLNSSDVDFENSRVSLFHLNTDFKNSGLSSNTPDAGFKNNGLFSFQLYIDLENS